MNVEYRKFADKAERYAYINAQLGRILEESESLTTALANASALWMLLMPRINWAGFYLLRGGHLILGPFQGKPAVARIEIGAGVCGTAVAQGEAQIVEDVHACCNHIACDAASASEIVVPLRANGESWGVIDIDSPAQANFDDEDLAGLQIAAEQIGGFAASRRTDNQSGREFA